MSSPRPCAGSSSGLLKFLEVCSDSPPVLNTDTHCHPPTLHEEPSALGAGAEADARLTGSNYE